MDCRNVGLDAGLWAGWPQNSERHELLERGPFFPLGSHRLRSCSCFRLPLNPFAEKGFWQRRRRTASPAVPWRSPCVASGKMSRVAVFSALKRTKALLANARNLENLYPRKRNWFFSLKRSTDLIRRDPAARSWQTRCAPLPGNSTAVNFSRPLPQQYNTGQDNLTPHITGSKKQSEAALFAVRVHVIVRGLLVYQHAFVCLFGLFYGAYFFSLL